MKRSDEQRLGDARRQHIEAIVAQHVRELFKRLPKLSGFWLRPERAHLRARASLTPQDLRAFRDLRCRSRNGDRTATVP